MFAKQFVQIVQVQVFNLKKQQQHWLHFVFYFLRKAFLDIISLSSIPVTT